MSTPNVVDNEELFESIVLGNVRSPGKVTLSGHDRKVNWDVKKGAGQSGATTTLSDVPPVEVTATFYLLKDVSQNIDDFADWDTFVEVVNSTVSGPEPKALDVYHPDLARNDIKSVVKVLVGGFTYDDKGGATVVVKFLEYRPPKPKGGTPNGSSSAARTKTKITPPDPNQAALDELARLTAQYQKTPWG